MRDTLLVAQATEGNRHQYYKPLTTDMKGNIISVGDCTYSWSMKQVSHGKQLSGDCLSSFSQASSETITS
jgi:hypothetical protein